jgi:hypothetical protein
MTSRALWPLQRSLSPVHHSEASQVRPTCCHLFFAFTSSHASRVSSHVVGAVGHGAACGGGTAAAAGWWQTTRGTTRRRTVLRAAVGVGRWGWRDGGGRGGGRRGGDGRVAADDAQKEAAALWDDAATTWCHTMRRAEAGRPWTTRGTTRGILVCGEGGGRRGVQQWGGGDGRRGGGRQGGSE